MGRYQELRFFYEVDKTIGTGGFAKVKLATHALTGEKVAIKIMEKASLGDDYHRVKLELAALKSISHQHICKLYQVIENPTHFFIVMEYCSGGELFDHIVEKNRLSEDESRLFFRQILSAVAHLHSQGYAHRDLKPENILLDGDMNLKLIDFGLCAKPSGGIDCHLKTSCGSPTYAAPELIKGNIYLGPEVDVWSMGVLLYALLCGFLPFDSDTIETLYKKILSGAYDEPPWLSPDSKAVMRAMLRVDPKTRITVAQLLQHPWVSAANLPPVSPLSTHQHRERREEAVEVMSRQQGLTPARLWERIDKWSYDYDTATYLLLVRRLDCGLPLMLRDRPFLRATLRAQHLNRQNELSMLSKSSPSKQFHDRLINGTNENSNMTPVRTVLKRPHVEEDCIRPEKENTKGKYVRKRLHPDEESPIPSKITPTKSRSTPSSSKTPATPNSPSNKFLYSLEKRLSSMKNALTPKKKAQVTQRLAPITLNSKNLCNVSTTSSTSPELVIDELKKALTEKGVICKCKGSRVRGRVEGRGRGCSFELEVCLVEAGGGLVVGIRRKRLKGDSWAYKQICEQILTVTQRLS